MLSWRTIEIVIAGNEIEDALKDACVAVTEENSAKLVERIRESHVEAMDISSELWVVAQGMSESGDLV